MSFARPRDQHEEAQQRVRMARDHLHAVKTRAADGRATADEVSVAAYRLDTELERLRHVQREAPDGDGATA